MPPKTAFTMHHRPSAPHTPRFCFPLLFFLILSCVVVLFFRFRAPSHPSTSTTLALLQAVDSRESQYTHLSDKVVYSRYARVFSRTIQFPDKQVVDYDIWGRVWRNDSFGVVTIVPFDAETRTLTLVREYNPAHTMFTYGFPQGQMELAKHGSSLKAAAAELEEEARLVCKEWVDLMDGNWAPQDKYQRERVWFYLCLKTEKVEGGRERDKEEDIDIVEGVTPAQLGELGRGGRMQSNQIAAAFLALDALRKMGRL